jgi:hypothetical protein
VFPTGLLDRRRGRRTDSGNAELFAHLYGERLRYDHRRRPWLHWDGNRWKPDVDEEVLRLATPEHAEEMAEARRLGGLRRRREKAVSGAYDFEGLADIGRVRRLLEIAALDSLALENSVARSRTLAYLAQVALKALERLVAPRLDKAGKRR